MPRELRTWGCEFRCGYCNTKHKVIAKHEQTCFRNPDRRACKTCIHNQPWQVPGEGCAREMLPEGATATVNCPFWEAKA